MGAVAHFLLNCRHDRSAATLAPKRPVAPAARDRPREQMMDGQDLTLSLGADEPTLTHRAIDRLSAALLDVQRLRRQTARVDGLGPDLERLETTLHELGDLLRQLQDRG
jgi:hypothetical protein